MSQPGPPRSSRPAGLFLVGFMGCGKTTVGQWLARRLHWRFQDLDARIEARQACDIPKIFSNHGEARFRQIEREALLELIGEMASSPTVAALGGGTFVQTENRSLLKATGFPSVFLDASAEDLWDRCRSSEIGRPLAQDQNQFRQLYESRRAFYMEAALTIDTTGKSADEVAAEVASRLQKASVEEK